MRARRRAALLLAAWALALGCRGRSGEATLVGLPPFSRALFDVERTLGAAERSRDAQPLQAVAATARAALERSPGRRPSVALGEAIFQTSAFVREVDDKDLRFVFLSSVLAERKGSCVGLGTLFLAVAELVGVRARGVMVPGHFYVQVDEGGRWRNVELLRRGEEMPDAWYRARYGAPEGPVAGRPLAPAEVVGVVAFDVGNQRVSQGRLVDARQAYARAIREFPTFAAAHASLGRVHHLLGALDEAAAAYAEARRLDPKLPGLDGNVASLEAERRRDR